MFGPERASLIAWRNSPHRSISIVPSSASYSWTIPWKSFDLNLGHYPYHRSLFPFLERHKCQISIIFANFDSNIPRTALILKDVFLRSLSLLWTYCYLYWKYLFSIFLTKVSGFQKIPIGILTEKTQYNTFAKYHSIKTLTYIHFLIIL